MKKWIALLLAIVTVFMLVACEKEEPADWQTGEFDEWMNAEVGKNFGNMPVRPRTRDYRYYEDSKIAELSFEHLETGHYIFARMKKASEWTNIMSDIPLDYSNLVDDKEVIGHPGQIMAGEDAGDPFVCGIWYDAKAGVVYSLAVVGEGGSLEAYAKDLFQPSKARK